MNHDSKYVKINQDILLAHIEVNTISIYITKFYNFKGIIPKNYFYVTKITEYGNYLFRAISQYFLGEENHHLYFRNILYNYILLNKNDEIFTASYMKDNHKIIEIKNYLGKIINEVSYGGDLEIPLISKLFNVSIYVFEYIVSELVYKFFYKH